MLLYDTFVFMAFILEYCFRFFLSGEAVSGSGTGGCERS
jgi:hypothetical protein